MITSSGRLVIQAPVRFNINEAVRTVYRMAWHSQKKRKEKKEVEQHIKKDDDKLWKKNYNPKKK